MTLDRIFAQLACTSLERSEGWFQRLFDRGPDDRPMQHLAEWRFGDRGGLQLFQDAANASHGVLTLEVDDLPTEHRRLEDAGLNPPRIEAGDHLDLLQLRDPDQNLVVLAGRR